MFEQLVIAFNMDIAGGGSDIWCRAVIQRTEPLELVPNDPRSINVVSSASSSSLLQASCLDTLDLDVGRLLDRLAAGLPPEATSEQVAHAELAISRLGTVAPDYDVLARGLLNADSDAPG